MPLAAIFDGRMSLQEAVSLTRTLIGDLTSHVGAAVQGWQYPLTHEARAAMDLYDLTVMVNTDPKKRSQIEKYPRPWPKPVGVRSQTPTVSQQAIRKALAARGH